MGSPHDLTALETVAGDAVILADATGAPAGALWGGGPGVAAWPRAWAADSRAATSLCAALARLRVALADAEAAGFGDAVLADARWDSAPPPADPAGGSARGTLSRGPPAEPGAPQPPGPLDEAQPGAPGSEAPSPDADETAAEFRAIADAAACDALAAAGPGSRLSLVADGPDGPSLRLETDAGLVLVFPAAADPAGGIARAADFTAWSASFGPASGAPRLR